MSKKAKLIGIVTVAVLVVALLVGIVLSGSDHGGHGNIQDTMVDAVLHEQNKISFFGFLDVNPAVVSAFTVTGVLLALAVVLRIFVIPKFKRVPGKLQLLLEMAVGFFDNLAKSNSPHKNQTLGGYIFAAGTYIFISTIFELFGLQGVTTEGHSIALPAPLADINAAIAMGFMSYGFILFWGIVTNGFRGLGGALKDFSLPISMSFRLFGALLSGMLVTELVYHYMLLSFVLPVIVAVLFTLIHAVIQTYVLTMLTAKFYGEVSEPHQKKPKKTKLKNAKKVKA